MKRLQCNFTTQEQSKRLLKLGVPAWTADCFYPTDNSDMPIIIADMNVGFHIKYAIPCWSVGRLIEIFRICTTIDVTLHIKSGYDENLVEGMIINLENMIDNEELDFSKLEE